MKYGSNIVPLAKAAFVHLGFDKEAWDQLEKKENWLHESGSDLYEAVYLAVFVERWENYVSVLVWDRIKRILEPYTPEYPDWLDDDSAPDLEATQQVECESGQQAHFETVAATEGERTA